MKILLVYLQPKEIHEVLTPLKEIPVDKLYLRYYPYPNVYKEAYNFIRDHSEYTHIFWLQNDIILTTEQFNKACYSYGIHKEVQILGLSMNVDTKENKHKCAFTTAPVSLNNLNIDWPIYGFFDGMIEVFHNGGPFLVKRELYLIFPLKGNAKGFQADVILGKELWENNITYYLDTDIHCKHLRYYGDMLVGKRKPEMEFIRWE